MAKWVCITINEATKKLNNDSKLNSYALLMGLQAIISYTTCVFCY